MSYVTFDASKDILGVFGDILTGDKDYKVIQDLEKGVQIIGDQGQTVVINKSFFYDDTLPESVYDGFENLVYVEPEGISEYFSIDTRKLSKEQHDFLKTTLDFSEDPLDAKQEVGEVFLCMDISDGKWFYYKESPLDTVISFNDIFVHKELNENNQYHN